MVPLAELQVSVVPLENRTGREKAADKTAMIQEQWERTMVDEGLSGGAFCSPAIAQSRAGQGRSLGQIHRAEPKGCAFLLLWTHTELPGVMSKEHFCGLFQPGPRVQAEGDEDALP